MQKFLATFWRDTLPFKTISVFLYREIYVQFFSQKDFRDSFFCSHAERSCAYGFEVSVNSAALYRNLAWNNSQNMSSSQPSGRGKNPMNC